MCALHDQEVQLVCHDVMHLAQLQRDFARSYGHFALLFAVMLCLALLCRRVAAH